MSAGKACGTNPIQAANWRAFLKLLGSSELAVMEPMPGMVSSADFAAVIPQLDLLLQLLDLLVQRLEALQ
ncbi:hypothetical protein VAR608DRAFT_1436 [Variovorax sp. HW608]|nr:hypothetical protein VAR608DRAFT_1436 [Variovorax sp. HW608]